MLTTQQIEALETAIASHLTGNDMGYSPEARETAEYIVNNWIQSANVTTMQIRTMQDVTNFIKYCLSLDLLFNPDTSFYDYWNDEKQEFTFSKDQARELQDALRDCCDVCNENNVDIYELTLKIQQP